MPLTPSTTSLSLNCEFIRLRSKRSNISKAGTVSCPRPSQRCASDEALPARQSIASSRLIYFQRPMVTTLYFLKQQNIIYHSKSCKLLFPYKSHQDASVFDSVIGSQLLRLPTWQFKIASQHVGEQTNHGNILQRQSLFVRENCQPFYV